MKYDGTIENEPDRDQKLTAYCYGVQGQKDHKINFKKNGSSFFIPVYDC